MIRIGQRLKHGKTYYADDLPYPGDSVARLLAVTDVHMDNAGGGFALRSFRKVTYLDRSGIPATWTQTTFERVR